MKELRTLKEQPITRADIGTTVYNLNGVGFIVNGIEDAYFSNGIWSTLFPKVTKDGLMSLTYKGVKTYHTVVDDDKMYREMPIIVSVKDFIKAGGEV